MDERGLGVVLVAVLSVHCAGDGAGASGADVADAASDTAVPSPTVDGGGPESSVPAVASAPVLQVGLDAYRQWSRWPALRIGTRTYMRSTFDRTGGNEGADASHFLRVEGGRAIALDLEGEGSLEFARFNRWHGSPWHFGVDGRDVAVRETNTAHPTAPTSPATFEPASVFQPPFALAADVTQGADIFALPMPFTQAFSVGYEHTTYGTGYFIYRLFAAGETNLSQPLAAFTGAPDASSGDVAALLARAGEDIAPTGAGITESHGGVSLPASASVTVLDTAGSGVARALTFTAPLADAASLGAATLRITWDDRPTASVEAPLALFFGAGSLVNRNAREWLVKAFPVSIHFGTTEVAFAVYFPMPYRSHLKVELVGGGAAAHDVPRVGYSLRTEPFTGPANASGYFHATYTDLGTPVPGKDLVFLDTRRIEPPPSGDAVWCGHVVGTSFTFSDRAVLGTLEGDPRFFLDDSETPQIQGTGTEEWGGGGDYWNNGQQTTLPFFGHPVGAPNLASVTRADDGIESAYRFLLADAVPFGRNARVQFEHGGVDEEAEHYRSVVYWYGLPGACLVPADTLHVGDAADEAAHRYVSPTASAVESLTSRYEVGVDHVGLTEVVPATTDTGRHTTGASEFSIAIAPDNLGVLLRRKLDYALADQRAEVFVADERGDGGDGGPIPGPFVSAGIWYLAGSNQVNYSNPPDENAGISPVLETSNRRFRDDEFLLPRALTEARNRIRLRIVPSPRTASATPAWSEYRYTAYTWSLP